MFSYIYNFTSVTLELLTHNIVYVCTQVCIRSVTMSVCARVCVDLVYAYVWVRAHSHRSKVWSSAQFKIDINSSNYIVKTFKYTVIFIKFC